MKIYSAQLKGTTTVATGSNVSLTGSFSGSIAGIDINATNQFTASTSTRLTNIEIISASNINRITSLETKSASVDISISNINAVTASNIARLSNLETKSSSVDISVTNINSFTASNGNTSLNQLTGSLATTGSNSFFGTQVFSGSVYIANDLIVQGSSSIQYISASSVSIGTNIVQLNTANPSVRYAGLSIIDSGSIGGSGSFLYDSLQDEFIFVHRGNGTNVTSSHFVLGPETYDSLGNETYLTCNVLTKGTGKEHLVDSCIFDNGTTTCIKNNLVGTGTMSGTTIFGSTITCSPIGCFATSCATSFIGGTMSGTTIYGSTAVCSTVGKFTSCIDAGAATFACSVQSNSIKLNTATSNGYFHIETSLPWGTKSNDLVNFTGYGYDGNIYTEHNYGSINWFSGTNKGASITAWRNLPADGDLFELAFATNPGGVCVYERMRIKSTGIACFACTVSTPFVSTNTIELGGSATSPTTACVGYGMFGYSGVGLAIAAGATGPNQGIGFFICGAEKGRWISSGNLAIGATCPRTRLQVTPQSNAEVPVLGCASGVATFTSANTNYGLQFNSTSDGSFHMQSQRFDASATSYALVLQPAGGTVAIGGNSSAAALTIADTETKKISYIGAYSIRTTTLFKTYNQGSTTDYWARISLNNSYADSTQGVYGVITVAWHPFHASMARFYQYRFFQAPYGTNNSYMKIQTVFEEAFGWDYYQFSSDVTFYNYQSYLYIKVTGSNANYAWARSIQAELTGGSYAMDNVNLEVGVAAPAGLSGLITKNGSAVLSG